MTPNEPYYAENYRPLLPADRDAPILDLGCGSGDLARYLSALGYKNVTAIDRDAATTEKLKGVEGIRTQNADITSPELSLGNQEWALIVLKQVIYYVDRRDVQLLMQSLHNSLRKDGRLIIEIFNGALLSSRFTELKDPGILTAYTELGLRRLLEQNGFVVESIEAPRLKTRRLRGHLYAFAQRLWFKLYRALLILERGWDDELPRIGAKNIIAVARP